MRKNMLTMIFLLSVGIFILSIVIMGIALNYDEKEQLVNKNIPIQLPTYPTSELHLIDNNKILIQRKDTSWTNVDTIFPGDTYRIMQGDKIILEGKNDTKGIITYGK